MFRFSTLLFIISILFSNCLDFPNSLEGDFMASASCLVVCADKEELVFNLAYTVRVTHMEDQDCVAETRKDLDGAIIRPTVRGAVRRIVGELNSTEVKLIDKELIRSEINSELTRGSTLNEKKLTNCPISIAMFAITKK